MRNAEIRVDAIDSSRIPPRSLLATAPQTNRDGGPQQRREGMGLQHPANVSPTQRMARARQTTEWAAPPREHPKRTDRRATINRNEHRKQRIEPCHGGERRAPLLSH
jgi:hypothetical protein